MKGHCNQTAHIKSFVPQHNRIQNQERKEARIPSGNLSIQVILTWHQKRKLHLKICTKLFFLRVTWSYAYFWLDSVLLFSQLTLPFLLSKKRWHGFCNDNHLLWSSAIHRWFKSIIDSKVLCKFFPVVFIGQLLTTKNQKIKLINITNLFPTACNVLFRTKINSSIWQMHSFHLTFSDASYSFSSVTTMPLSWKRACMQLHDKHH